MQVQSENYISLSVKPNNSKRGAAATLYLYVCNEARVQICQFEHPHVFCTKRISYEDAKRLEEHLSKKFANKSYEIKKVQSGKYYVLQVRGPRELKDELPDCFLKESNVSEFLNWAFPPFSKISIEGEKILVKGPASLEEILQMPILAIDSELDKEKQDYYARINTIALASKNEVKVFSIFDEQEKDSQERQKKLILYAESEILKEDPAIICSHNIAFDLLQPREKVGEFCIGVDGSSPVIKGGIGLKKKKNKNRNEDERKGFPKVEVAGRALFCSMSFARNNLWCTNNKLETVAKFLGINYVKDVNYEELEELVKKADKGDIEAKEKIKNYCANDCKIHFKLAKRLLPIAIREALAFETDLMSVCFTSKTALARKLRDKRYFEALGTFRKDRTIELREFDVYSEKLNLMKSSMKVKLNFEPERGYFEEPLIVVFPNFLELAFFKLLSKERAAAVLRQGIAKSQSILDKIIFHRDLEALCEEPLFDLYKYRDATGEEKEKAKAIFLGRYKTHPEEILKELYDKLEELTNLLSKAKVKPINYSNRFLFLKPLGNLEESLQILKNSKQVEFYAITKAALSGEGGRILASIDGIAITSQLDIYGHKGLRTNFEREIYSYLLEFITGKLKKPDLYNILKEKFSALAQGKIPKEDLIYYIEANLEPWEYSWPAQKTKRVKALKELGAREGEKLAFGYGINPKGKIRKYKADIFLQDNIKPDISAYQNNFFGEKVKNGRKFPNGSISDLIYSIWPVSEESERRELDKFFEGRPAPRLESKTKQKKLGDF